VRRLYLPLILFLLLALEGVALDLLPISLLNNESIIISHWVFVFLLYIAIFFDSEQTYYSIIYGAVFGLLIDIVYTDVLGVYMFSYVIGVYMVFILKKLLHTNLIVTILLGIIGISIADILIYIVYAFIGITYLPMKSYLIYRLVPTVLANLIFLIIIYPFTKKRLIRWRKDQLIS